MDTLNNIIILPGKQGANSLQDQTSGLSKDDLIAFVTALVQNSGQMGKDGDLAAKLSQLVKDKKLDSAEVLKLLQKMPAGENDALLKQLAAMLKTAPEVKPALTSDLTSSMSAQLQDAANAADPESLLKQLREQFDAMGEISPEKLAQFRQDAIAYMKSVGLDAVGIEGMLVRLTMDLGSSMTEEQATLLMMPFRPDMPEMAEAAPKARPVPVSAAPITPQELAERQLYDAAQSPQLQKSATRPATAPEKASAPAPQQPAPQIQQPLPDTQAAKPAPQAASNLALINSFAGEDGFSGGGFGGQSFGQGSSYMTGGTAGGLQMAGKASSESFVNYMHSSGAGGAPSTQMIALQIQRNAQAQIDTFRMQLQPAELGRLEVRLKFGHDGSLKAHLVADKADTLMLLQKDQAQLQRILQQAGLNVDDGALSFDLRQQNQQDTGRSYNGQGQSSGNDDGDDFTATAALQAKISAEAMGSIRPGGVNIMV